MIKEKSTNNKEKIKKSLYLSAGITVASSFFTDKKIGKRINTTSALTTLGLATWYLFLNKKSTKKEIENHNTDKLAINLHTFYIEFSIKGILTKKEFKTFEEKIESLLKLYSIPKINILIDITEIEDIEIKSLWDDFLFSIRHFKEINKVSIVGSNKFEEYTIKVTNKIISKEIMYFETFDEAHKWLLK